jgi:hypothetical protein
MDMDSDEEADLILDESEPKETKALVPLSNVMVFVYEQLEKLFNTLCCGCGSNNCEINRHSVGLATTITYLCSDCCMELTIEPDTATTAISPQEAAHQKKSLASH